MVDPDVEAAGAVAFQLLQPVTGWHEQILETSRGIREEQLPPRCPLNGTKTGDGLIVEQPFGVTTPEGLNHETSLLLHRYYVKRKTWRDMSPDLSSPKATPASRTRQESCPTARNRRAAKSGGNRPGRTPVYVCGRIGRT
jgi:hypothetical protein